MDYTRVKLNSIEAYNPDSQERRALIEQALTELNKRCEVQLCHTIQGDVIEDLDISELTRYELDRLKLHFTQKNNGRSIELNGLKAQIGGNSQHIDQLKSLYFSWGFLAALSNYEVWLRWRTSQLYSAFSAQAIKTSYKPKPYEEEQRLKWINAWMNKIATGFDNVEDDKLELTFRYCYTELSTSYYLSLGLTEGVDFDPYQIDPKKEWLKFSAYAQEINAVGIHTDCSTSRAEKWNMSTELGKDFVLPPERIRKIVLPDGSDDAYSILRYFWDIYQKDSKPKKSGAYATLAKFFAFCDAA